MSECPRHISEVEAVGDPRVLIDVMRIIVVNEIVPDRLTKNRPRKHCQSDANAGGRPGAAAWRVESAWLRTNSVHVRRKLRNEAV